VTVWPALFIAASFSLLALPLVPALVEWRRKRDAAPLRVVRAYDVNPAHFAHGFRAFVERQFRGRLDAARAGEAVEGLLEDGTAFLLLGAGRAFALSADEERSQTVRRLLVTRADLQLPGCCLFEADTYSGGSIHGQGGSAFRALFAEGDLLLGDGCAVLRWAHAGGRLRAGEDLEARGRMTAGRVILLGPGSTFGRLHAPLVVFGEREEAPAEAPAGAAPQAACAALAALPSSGGRHLVKGDLELPARTRHRGDLVTSGELRFGPGCEVAGSLKSNAALHLGAGARVEGAVVAVGALFIGEGCYVRGPVVSESVVHLGGASVVGLSAHPTSISAPRVVAGPEARVHGTVWAREEGRVAR